MAARIILEFLQIPEAKDLALLIALAEKFNARVVKIPDLSKSGKKTAKRKVPSNSNSARPEDTSTESTLPSLRLDFEKFPQNLNSFAIKPEQLDALAKIFEDELDAETLTIQLRNLPIAFAQKPNALALSGIWKNQKISPDQLEDFQNSLRQRASGDRL